VTVGWPLAVFSAEAVDGPALGREMRCRFLVGLRGAVGGEVGGRRGRERLSRPGLHPQTATGARLHACAIDEVREHAQQDVTAHVVRRAVMDGSDVEVDRLQCAKGPFNLTDGLVVADGVIRSSRMSGRARICR
jgi:hypothetical protein